MKNLSNKVREASCIVIKIGSALLINESTGRIKSHWVKSLCKDIALLKSSGKKIILVSSGSIAIGREILNLKFKSIKLEEKQAAAAVGQGQLMHLWAHYLAQHQITAAQILLAPEDTETRRRHLNARATIKTLLNLDVIPVVNENDTIATSEIKYGDNDRLASRVAQIINADNLVLFSDVDGLYTDNPKKNNKAKLIKEIKDIEQDLTGVNIKGINEYGSGGMKTKIEAAKICQLSGSNMIIANGLKNHPIQHILNGDNYTLFVSKLSKLDARKKWILSSISPKGSVIIDDGANKALGNGKSLLAAGIKKVVGKFNKGDHIKVLNKRDKEIARGLASFSSEEIKKILGKHSNEIEKILGYVSKSEVIHKDDMVEII